SGNPSWQGCSSVGAARRAASPRLGSSPSCTWTTSSGPPEARAAPTGEVQRRNHSRIPEELWPEKTQSPHRGGPKIRSYPLPGGGLSPLSIPTFRLAGTFEDHNVTIKIFV